MVPCVYHGRQQPRRLSTQSSQAHERNRHRCIRSRLEQLLKTGRWTDRQPNQVKPDNSSSNNNERPNNAQSKQRAPNPHRPTTHSNGEPPNRGTTEPRPNRTTTTTKTSQPQPNDEPPDLGTTERCNHDRTESNNHNPQQPSKHTTNHRILEPPRNHDRTEHQTTTTNNNHNNRNNQPTNRATNTTNTTNATNTTNFELECKAKERTNDRKRSHKVTDKRRTNNKWIASRE